MNAFASTPDGYLWIGCEKGLVRFDGVSFRLFDHTVTASLPDGPVLGLTTDAQGELWVRLQSPDLLRYHGGTFKQALPGELPEIGVTAMANGNHGDVLLARAPEPLRYTHGNFVPLVRDPLNGRPFLSIAETPDGRVWVGTRDEGLLSLHNGQSPPSRSLPGRKINTLLPGNGTDLWIGTDSGLVHWTGSEISRRDLPASLSHVQVLALARDHDSNLWAGTTSGLVRLDQRGAATSEQLHDGRPKPVSALFEDREGNLWAGGTDFIEQYRDSVFLSYRLDSGPLYVDSAGRAWYGPSNGGLSWLTETKRGSITSAGLKNDVVYSITGAPGELWIGRQRGGLTQVRKQGGSFTSRTYSAADGLAPGSVYAVLRTHDGSVWAGTLNGGVSRLRNDRITTYTTANGLLSNSISAIEEAQDGTVWIATPNGLQSFAHEQWRAYSDADGIPPGRVNCLTRDSAGVLWIGTDAGLAFIRNGRLQIPRDTPRSLLEPVLGIADDNRGSLWIATSVHVLRAPRVTLLGDAAGQGEIREFGPADGIKDTAGIRRQRSIVNDSLGRIWLSLHGGISVVDPARINTRSAPAIIHIQAVTADGRPLNPAKLLLRIPVARQRIIISYIGLSLSVPDRVRYRYRLDGFDKDWSEPSPSRDSLYTNLAPGRYHFRVIASNGEGIWNSSEASIAMEIVPAIWQTWWFRVLVLAACTAVTIVIYRLRLRRLTARLNLAFEERLAERTRIAQELHDTLLQGFLSASMHVHVAAEQVPEDSSAKPALRRALDLMRRVIEDGRNAVRGLRTSDDTDLDLEQSFSKIQGELVHPSTPPVDFRVTAEGERRPLNPALREEVYRIGREALINAFRHSRAKTIEVELKYSSNRVRVLVRDDGCGIDPETLRNGRDGHFGLLGMRERAGRIGARLNVTSNPTAGTEIELSVPANIAYAKPETI